MKKSCTLFLLAAALAIASAAQQTAKPSPAERQTAPVELKQSPKAPPATSQTAPAAATAATPNPVVLAAPTLPVGTAIRMRLETPLYTGSTQEGSTFYGRVLEDVKLNDRVVIPVGASLQGQVVRVTEPRRFRGRPTIQLRPESVTLPNGQKQALNAVVVDTHKVNGTDVDDEGRIKGPGHSNRDVIEIGAGTGAGAIVGAVVAGGKGSLIGAGIGAGGTLIHWLIKKNDAYLPTGSEIIFELSRPMTVEPVQVALER